MILSLLSMTVLSFYLSPHFTQNFVSKSKGLGKHYEPNSDTATYIDIEWGRDHPHPLGTLILCLLFHQGVMVQTTYEETDFDTTEGTWLESNFKLMALDLRGMRFLQLLQIETRTKSIVIILVKGNERKTLVMHWSKNLKPFQRVFRSSQVALAPSKLFPVFPEKQDTESSWMTHKVLKVEKEADVDSEWESVKVVERTLKEGKGVAKVVSNVC
ncbi:hypothetical protein VNO77_18816 [Canavalia gladiata]|uniref:Uncharacterized protein n=1 Tax=Canavalia gladiata TaxID=3824 RepID=A0AAN9LPY9_CANGL